MNKRTKSERRHTLHDRANLSHLFFLAESLISIVMLRTHPCWRHGFECGEEDIGDGGGDRAWGVRTVVGVSLLSNTTKPAP
jgi:hypothetical protein